MWRSHYQTDRIDRIEETRLHITREYVLRNLEPFATEPHPNKEQDASGEYTYALLRNADEVENKEQDNAYTYHC